MKPFDLIQTLALTVSLVFLGIQVGLQRKELRSQADIQSYELYYRMVSQYLKLLDRASDDPCLNAIWVGLTLRRKRELDAAQRASKWGAWFLMKKEEKKCYRYVRAALEIFEQAHQVRQKGWIDDQTWLKWRGWMEVWSGARYLSYVLEDNRARLLDSFVREFESLLK